ncbi:MAG: sulfatase [Planctomycetota bacterium]|jgi:arylsulfatase A-like enzyme
MSSKWKRPAAIIVIVAALAALVSLMPGRGAAAVRGSEIRRVVVIHLDTTRADDLGCYGGIPRTPNIDAVAARGMRYTNSIAPVPKTSPSIASFMTGRLANRHGVYDVGGLLQDKFMTLPELLKQHGFVTGGFVSNLVVDKLKTDKTKSAGFDQGFDVYKGIRALPDVPEGAEENAVPRTVCAPLIDEALAFVEEHRDEPFFLWMLHLDPHAPYAPPAPYDTMYLDHPQLTARSVTLDPAVIHHQAYVSGRLDSHEYIARHLGEVTLVDAWLGRLFARLDELPGRTLLVITADHGESLGDVNYWFGPGSNSRHPCVNVPLIIACDGVVPVGVSDTLVANIDLAPTILHLLGIDAGALEANGLPLSATYEESDPWPDRMIPLQAYGGDRWRGVRSADFCLQSLFDPQTGRYLGSQLYDLDHDPNETVDASDRLPRVFQDHLALQRAWFEQAGQPETEVHLRDDPEMIRRLRSLGYLR